MTIEQRLTDALSDLEASLNEGTPVDDALASCAADYGLKVEVLRGRAEKIFGELSSLRKRNLKKAEILAREHRAETAIERYLAEDPDANFPSWFEAEVGRAPTKIEQDESTSRYLTFLLRDLRIEI